MSNILSPNSASKSINYITSKRVKTQHKQNSKVQNKKTTFIGREIKNNKQNKLIMGWIHFDRKYIPTLTISDLNEIQFVLSILDSRLIAIEGSKCDYFKKIEIRNLYNELKIGKQKLQTLRDQLMKILKNRKQKWSKKSNLKNKFYFKQQISSTNKNSFNVSTEQRNTENIECNKQNLIKKSFQSKYNSQEEQNNKKQTKYIKFKQERISLRVPPRQFENSKTQTNCPFQDQYLSSISFNNVKRKKTTILKRKSMQKCHQSVQKQKDQVVTMPIRSKTDKIWKKKDTSKKKINISLNDKCQNGQQEYFGSSFRLSLQKLTVQKQKSAKKLIEKRKSSKNELKLRKSFFQNSSKTQGILRTQDSFNSTNTFDLQKKYSIQNQTFEFSKSMEKIKQQEFDEKRHPRKQNRLQRSRRPTRQFSVNSSKQNLIDKQIQQSKLSHFQVENNQKNSQSNSGKTGNQLKNTKKFIQRNNWYVRKNTDDQKSSQKSNFEAQINYFGEHLKIQQKGNFSSIFKEMRQLQTEFKQFYSGKLKSDNKMNKFYQIIHKKSKLDDQYQNFYPTKCYLKQQISTNRNLRQNILKEQNFQIQFMKEICKRATILGQK